MNSTKYSFSIFFLVIMTLNVVCPLVERLQKKDMYELTEFDMDDTDEESKKGKEGKEVEKEKDTISFSTYILGKFEIFSFKKPLVSSNDCLISEPFTSLPKRPPKA